MFGRLLLLFVTVPLIELSLLIKLTQLTSLPFTIALVITTGVAGLTLVRWQGFKALQQIQKQLSSGQSPAREIIDGVMILIAGAFLITPGPLTDSVGFCLLIPRFRRWIAGRVQKSLLNRATSTFQSGVWVTQIRSGHFSGHADSEMAAPSETSETPQVLVIDPNTKKLSDSDSSDPQ